MIWIPRLRFDLRLVILLTLLNYALSQRLPNACKHNEFRCSDGRCLQGQQMCDGRRNCAGGEDERGDGSRWNCKSMTLAKDYCDPAQQFRCRFGGCISRSSLCDGRVDCWGGGDEAYDVCTGTGNPVIPVLSGSTNVRKPPQPQPQPPPAPPTPPQRTPQRTTTTTSRPPQIFPSQISTGTGSGSCGPINENPVLGYEVVCENSRRYQVECGDAPSGGIAQYQCKKYFTPTSSLLLSTTRTCENGRWSQLNNRFGCEAICGISSSELSAFVVGGSVAKAGKWPWMAAIYERSPKNPSKFEFICGASLISAKAVITAAHCVVRRDSGVTKSFSDLKIVVGKYYRSHDRKSTGEQERGIKAVYVYDEYNRITLRGDIAIIKLAEPVEITETVRPVCLPTSNDYTQSEQHGTLVGWGRGDGKAFKEQLQQAKLPVVAQQSCIDAHPQFAHLVHQGTFCAGYRNGTSACDGDSGGPLVFPNRYSPSKWVLHGVVSAGIAAADGRSGCNPNYYTVFTDVAYHTIRNWISYTIGSHFNN